jgi:hypothetical protein
MSGSNSQTRRLEGTAAIGCGRLVRNAKKKQRQIEAPFERIGSATASPSGML